MVKFNNDWDEILKGEFNKEYYLSLRQFLINEYKTRVVYPSMYDIFNALKLTSYSDVKIVILGQDPYHEPNQAHGLAFSVQKGVKIPPSLVNIYKELHDDIGFDIPLHGCLTEWAEKGVLLLNTVLTVRKGQANSHKNKGWEQFTDEVIRKLNERDEPIVFVLWGANARSKKKLISNSQHHIVESVHPSPLSAHRGFLGSRCFSKINRYLAEPMDWSIT